MKFLCFLLTCLLHVRFSDELAVMCSKLKGKDCRAKLCEEAKMISGATSLKCPADDFKSSSSSDKAKWFKTVYDDSECGGEDKNCSFVEKAFMCPYSLEDDEKAAEINKLVNVILDGRGLKQANDPTATTSKHEHSKFIYAAECDKYESNQKKGKKEEYPWEEIKPLKTCTNDKSKTECPRGSQCTKHNATLCYPIKIANCGSNVKSLMKNKTTLYASDGGKCTLKLK